MLADRLLMHCGGIFKTIPFRNDSSYVSYIFFFSVLFPSYKGLENRILAA